MKHLNKTILLILGLVLLNSCDCLLHVQGVVMQPNNEQPIDNVLITKHFKNDSIIFVTDKNGRFDYNSMVHGIFGCPRIKLSFEKEGFESIIKSYRSCCTDNDTIILKRKEQ